MVETETQGDGRHNRDVRARRIPLLAALAGVLAAAVLAAAAASYVAREPDDQFGQFIDPATVQAVILSNESVYFGRLEGKVGDFYRLVDVYFLSQSVDTGTDEVVRRVQPLSAEIQTPTDELMIHERHLVVIENLDEESDVLATIERLEDETD